MRALILVLFVLGVVVCAHSANAGLSTTQREPSASVDIVADEANLQIEDQIGLTKTKRRDVQRRLTRLGFGTKVNGRFDDSTRDAIADWQGEHGYPKTGFLNTEQHEALLSESATDAGKSDRHRGGGRARHSRRVGGPFGVIGHVVGGLFRR
jgi:peptidoglycan hydrolase-like protein with peptidoglycan-binding domain